MADENFGATPCFWYYGILVLILIIVGWVSILIGYTEREANPYVPKYQRGWPANANTSEYYVHSIIPYIVWTFFLLMFAWGAYHADCRDLSGERVQIYRIAYLTVIVLDVLALFLFFIQHNVIAALVAHVLGLALLIGLIMLYSEINVADAWFAYPYLLYLTFFIYFFIYIIRMNANHPDMRNFLFAL
ncbi:Hypothetical protein HVR_LOCUS739 [uncultured virus]|nr:Hypothetical protein HVR_LOCUS739 [uncultured virus]